MALKENGAVNVKVLKVLEYMCVCGVCAEVCVATPASSSSEDPWVVPCQAV